MIKRKDTVDFLGMCTTREPNKMNATLQINKIQWHECVGLSFDNAPINRVAQINIASRILNENSDIYVYGCLAGLFGGECRPNHSQHVLCSRFLHQLHIVHY